MSGNSKSKGNLWYGYLDVGEKSSAVIRDDRLDTGNHKTLFLFNLARGQILEYTREIVEPKLRELKASEAGMIDALNAAYGEARRTLQHHNVRPLNIPDRADLPKSAKGKGKNNDEDSISVFGAGSDDDEDVWIDSVEEEES